MEHLKKILVVSCIDYRFWPQALSLLQKKYRVFDLIQIAGASKNLTSPLEKEDKITLLENIEISMKLHNTQKIILVNHIDCGAYGGSIRFQSQKEEIKFHKEELKKAKEIIQYKFPQLVISTELLIINNNKKIKLL